MSKEFYVLSPLTGLANFGLSAAMSIIATLAVPIESFPLGRLAAGETPSSIKLARVVPLGQQVFPYLWVSDGLADLESMLQDDPDIASYDVVDATGDAALVKVAWSPGVNGFLDAVHSVGANVLEAVTEAGRWHVRLRFDEDRDLTEFHRHCAAADISFELLTVHNPGLYFEQAQLSELTPVQRETIQTALESGYFDVPRETNLVELAEELGVSDSAVSQRLRRGIRLVLDAVNIDQDDHRSLD